MTESKPSSNGILRVVAGLIWRGGEVLLTQRRPGRHLGLSWEFPGGKVEPGESDEEALRRELDEELGVKVKVGHACYETKHSYGPREMSLKVFRCTIESGEPRAIDVNAMEWVKPANILEKEFLPADMPLVKGIAEGLINASGNGAEDDDGSIPFTPPKVLRRIELPKS